MVFVIAADQRGSRSQSDAVPEALRLLAERIPSTWRPFERTAGDEIQGVLRTAGDVVEVVLQLVRLRVWSVGVGMGPVEEPLPESTRAGRGPAFACAREAVERAKRRPQHLAVVGRDTGPARDTHPVGDAQAALSLLVAVTSRRSAAAWAAVDLAAAGLPAQTIADRLVVTRQAVSQRLATVSEDCRGRPAR